MLLVMSTSAAIAAVVALLCSWPWRSPHHRRSSAGWVVGIAAAVYAGCLMLGIRLHWPPLEDLQRFLIILFPATVLVELTAGSAPFPRWVAVALRLLLAAAAPWILLHGSSYLVDLAGPGSRQWSPGQAVFTLAVLGATLLMVWYLLAVLQRRGADLVLPLTLAGTCLGAGIAVMLSDYLTGGQIGLPLGAAVPGATAAALVTRAKDRASRPLGIVIVSLFSLVIMGRFFGHLTTTHALLLFLAPLLCWLPALSAPRRLPAWGRGRSAGWLHSVQQQALQSGWVRHS